MRPLPRLLALAAVAAVALPAAGHAAPRPALLLGIQDDALLSSAEPDAWPLLRQLGPGVVRYNVAWNAVAATRPEDPSNPADPAYDWTAVDAMVQNTAAAGATPLLSIVQTPPWANFGQDPAVAPTSAVEYGRFCGAVAVRYSGNFVRPGDEAPLPRVERFTVWNEPNRGQYLRPQGPGGTTAARIEAGLVRTCAPAIRASTPTAKVALGPLASRGAQGGLAPVRFLRFYHRAGGPRPDVVAVNPYLDGLLPVYRPREVRPDGAITLRNLDQLQTALRKEYGRRLPLWITEFGVRVGTNARLGYVTPARQAQLARQSMALVHDRYPTVGVFVWFLLRDQSLDGYWQSGLVGFDWSPKPVYGIWKRRR